MKALDKKIFKDKGFLHKMNDSLQKEQREFFFHKKSEQEEKDYFNFFKFLFNSPDRVGV